MIVRDSSLVPRAGLEPAHLAAHAPETCASTNSATWACGFAQFVLRLAVQRYYIFLICKQFDEKIIKKVLVQIPNTASALIIFTCNYHELFINYL